MLTDIMRPRPRCPSELTLEFPRTLISVFSANGTLGSCGLLPRGSAVRGAHVGVHEDADPQHPAVQPVPYEGIQYVGIPSFQSIGIAVGYQMNDAFTGDITAKKALENSQWATGRVIKLTDNIEYTQSSN